MSALFDALGLTGPKARAISTSWEAWGMRLDIEDRDMPRFYELVMRMSNRVSEGLAPGFGLKEGGLEGHAPPLWPPTWRRAHVPSHQYPHVIAPYVEIVRRGLSNSFSGSRLDNRTDSPHYLPPAQFDVVKDGMWFPIRSTFARFDIVDRSSRGIERLWGLWLDALGVTRSEDRLVLKDFLMELVGNTPREYTASWNYSKRVTPEESQSVRICWLSLDRPYSSFEEERLLLGDSVSLLQGNPGDPSDNDWFSVRSWVFVSNEEIDYEHQRYDPDADY